MTFETKIQVDKTADYEQMLGEVFYVLDRYYYDPAHHKADWKALYERFKPVLQQVREDQDFADYANLMIGELNSSHMGFSMPRDGAGRRAERATSARSGPSRTAKRPCPA